MKPAVRLAAIVLAITVGTVCGAALLFYAGVEWVFVNRFFNLTYWVHDGTDAALEEVSAKGAFEALTYEQYAERVVAEAKARGPGAERDLGWVKSEIVHRLREINSSIEMVYLQDGKCYCNIGCGRVYFGYTTSWGWETVHVPIFPHATNLLGAIEVPPHVVPRVEGEWDWRNLQGGPQETSAAPPAPPPANSGQPE